MNIAYLALKALIFKAKLFEAATKDPLKTQKKILFEYLRRNASTEYGRKYNFSHIKSIEDYQRLVPLSDCETMRPYLDRMAGGEPNILTADRPTFFGATSGTTSLPKYIPSTKYSDSKKNEIIELWGYYIARDHPAVFKGKILAIVSPEIEGQTGSGAPYGGESGHGYNTLNALVKKFYVLPYRVFEITDYDSRYYTILRISMEHDVTNIATLNPKSIMLLCQKIEGWKEKIIGDIESGALSADLDIPPDIRKELMAHLKPNPGRAALLRSILKEKGNLLPKYFWPKMELIECWKAGSMKAYLNDLSGYFGKVAIRDIGVLSTEARSSIPMSDEGASGVLAIRTNFYEFIPKDTAGAKEKPMLLCDHLEEGKDYFLVVTTPGGLYRYNIDDIVRVTGYFNRTPVIEFLQKGLNAASLAGEKLYESQVNDALNRVLAAMKLSVEFFSACAQVHKMPHYAFLVEFSKEPGGGEKKTFLVSMERELRRENREYEYTRGAQLLGPPVLKVARRGEYIRYRAKKIQEGAHDAQFKTPELTTDSGFVKNFEIEEELTLEDQSFY